MDNASPDVSATAPAAPAAPASNAPAESSPAPIQIPRDEAAYLEWRKTGEIPEAKQAKPKTEESAPSKQPSEKTDSAEGADDAPEGKTAPGSEPGTARQERRGSAADRLNEILGDLKKAGLTPLELKNFRREAQAQAQAKPSETTAQPPQPAEAQPPKKPNLNDFKSWDEFEKAKAEYDEWVIDQRVERGVSQALSRIELQRAQQEAQAKLEAANKRYGADAANTIQATATAVFHDAGVHPAIKAVLNDSPVIADVLYTLGSKTGDLQQFLELARTNPSRALRQAVLMEHLVQEELAKATTNGKPATDDQEETETPERDESGRFVSAKPAKRTTEAPPPSREVSGRASPPADEADVAFARAQKGDPNSIRNYFETQNRRDMAERRGR